MLVSSAKGVNLIVQAQPMSLISIKNRKGCETESWGTQHIMSNIPEFVPL